MVDPFLGEVRLMSFIFAPKGWALCNGQLMAISQNQALFALLGTTYGGNGVQTFGLPDLRGRAGTHFGGQVALGETAGTETVTLLSTQMPAHNHPFYGTNPASPAAVTRPPTGGLFANNPNKSPLGNFYAADSNTLQPLHPKSITPNNGGQPHDNMQPYLVLNYCIALQGIFPSRN